MDFEFSAELWEYTGMGAWFFVTVPADISKEIRVITEGPRRGFGSVRVTVKSGDAQWNTSIFPDAKAGAYLLPIKKQIRTQLGLSEGFTLKCGIRLIDY
jgi:hypothetical protein